MSTNQTTWHEKNSDGSQTGGFFWEKRVRDTRALRWRTGAKHHMGALIEDEAHGPYFCLDPRRYEAVAELSRGLIHQPNSLMARSAWTQFKNATWAGIWEGAKADISDQRAVVRFFANQLARQIDWPTVLHDGERMGTAHVRHWMQWITSLAWKGVKPPHWLDEGARTVIIQPTDTETVPARAWMSEDEAGLHEDLVIFLTEFSNERRKHPLVPLARVNCIIQSLILLRALAVVAPERIPDSSVKLIDEMEKLLNMDGLKNETLVNDKTYAVVRSAWDLKLLTQSVRDRQSTVSTGVRRRTL